MLYLYKSNCISPQPSQNDASAWENLVPTVENKVSIIEPSYESIPDNLLRRMGKALRMGVGSALNLIATPELVDGIVIGTANGGMEDCIKFLNQIIDYNEGMLTPTNFVQSTPNAIAAQISLLSSNKGYNATHVHRGLAFENALLDAIMLAKENPQGKYLVGGVDEISDYNFKIDTKGGWYKSVPTNATDLYFSTSEGSLAGEGAAFFLTGAAPSSQRVGSIVDIVLLHTNDTEKIQLALSQFLEVNQLTFQNIEGLMLGENGDVRYDHYYREVEDSLSEANVFRYKHLCGEYPTASAYALWYATILMKQNAWPSHAVKQAKSSKPMEKMLIYNHFKGEQHGFMLVVR